MTRYTPMYVQDGSYAASVDRHLISALWPNPASTGCAVSVSSGMTLNVAVGTVAVPTQNNTGSTLCVSDAVESVVIGASPPSGQSRIDLVICRPRDVDLDGSSNIDFIFDVVAGTATSGTPAVPATPAGTVALCRVTVPGGAAAIVAGNLTDVRPFGLPVASASGLPPALSSGAAFQSFTSGDGEIWVAKGGVNAGAWKRARDVLHCRHYKTGAFTLSGTGNNPNYEASSFDDYTLYNGTVFIAAIPGIWQLTCQTAANPSTTGQYAETRIFTGATLLSSAVAHASSTAGITALARTTIPLTAGQSLAPQALASTTMPGVTGTEQTWGEFSYLGSR